MARSLNKAMIIGNLGNDPDVRTVGSGTKVVEFSVATSRSWTGRDGQQQEKTEWHRVVVWGNSPEKDGLAGVAERFLKKGERVYVEGSIEYRQYEAKDGSGTRYITEIRASDLVLLGGRGEGGGGDFNRGEYGGSRGAPREQQRPAAAKAGKSSSYDDFEMPSGEDDDLPF